ncbi:MAG: DUF1573 domain-containing protein, partial [Firmicutes bacterium]|nr:DUF1573 domain-containing protein [Bacillota bacterium]
LMAGGLALWRGAARPRVAVEPATLDFGRIRDRATRTAVVHNRGWASLQVLAVSSSCGCTTPAIEAWTVAPRRATRLTITFDAAAHGPQGGPARNVVYVRTNDPSRPEVEVEVRAWVLR